MKQHLAMMNKIWDRCWSHKREATELRNKLVVLQNQVQWYKASADFWRKQAQV